MHLSGITGHTWRHTVKAGDKFRLWLMSDLHLGASSTNEKRIKEELQEAVDSGARILINGDVIDGILPKDPRYQPSVIVEQLRGKDALINSTIEYVVEFLDPYVHNIDEISDGNHELSVLSHNSGDILDMVVKVLNLKHGTNIKHGSYIGFVTWHFGRLNSTSVISYRGFRSHGYTKSAPVSKGIMEFARNADSIEGVDFQWLGHSHDVTMHPTSKLFPGRNGEPQYKEQWNIRTGSYMMHSEGSYPTRKGMLPKPHGGAGIELTFKADKTAYYYRTRVTK